MTERVQGPAYYFPSIEKKYGRPVSYWLGLIAASPLTKHKALVDWLKADYGLGHGHATALVGHALAQRAAGSPAPDEAGLLPSPGGTVHPLRRAWLRQDLHPPRVGGAGERGRGGSRLRRDRR
jgi:Domain of unknown function (DUF4287)